MDLTEQGKVITIVGYYLDLLLRKYLQTIVMQAKIACSPVPKTSKIITNK